MRLVTAVVLIAGGAALSPALFPATPPAPRQSSNLSDEIPSTCPVTKPSEHPFIPPAPYPAAGAFAMGSEKLWTNIPRNGAWFGLSHYTPDDPRFRQKLFWWSEGYDWRTENPPHLTVRGDRLDAPASFVTTDQDVGSGWTNDRDHAFMVVGIFIPTVGCWKITGEYKGEELSYVVWITGSRLSADANKCSANDLLAVLRPDDPVYIDALNLARTLQVHGFVVKCVLQSKMIDIFEGQKGAAVFRTDQGDFDALFLPNTQTFDALESIEVRENGRFLYSFLGRPSPASPHPIDSAYPMFFAKHANQFFITSTSHLATTITKSLT
jgi:hypothetical protein